MFQVVEVRESDLESQMGYLKEDPTYTGTKSALPQKIPVKETEKEI